LNIVYWSSAPEKPANLVLTSTPPYTSTNGTREQQLCDVMVTWNPSKYRRHRNFISNYTLTFQKLPYMSNSDVVVPHRGTFYVPAVSRLPIIVTVKPARRGPLKTKHMST
jgi:hypothetical protein